MTDDTLVNGLKAIFGTSAQGSAPASSALIPYMDASGNPVGLSSMSNLASVLGALQKNGWVSDSLDNATTNGVWQVGGGLSDNPVGNTAILTVFNSNNYIVQYIAGANSCFVRIKQTNWQPWVRIDNFGCNTASELASLLGGLGTTNAHVLSDGDDVNNCNKTGIYTGGSEMNVLNRPGTGSFRVICIASENNIWMQIGYNYNGEFYIRRQWGVGNITAWKQL